jgi:transcriptional regulator with XRE-family HTH domain
MPIRPLHSAPDVTRPQYVSKRERMTEIGELLTAARGPRSIYRVEKETEISHAAISKAERGKILPSVALLDQLARYYDRTDELDDWIAALERDRIARQRARLAQRVAHHRESEAT